MSRAKGPLAGVRVLDFSRLLAGAGGTRVLANYGAEVIRVEWPHYPAADYLRFSAPFKEGQSGPNCSGFFNNINPDKRSFTLNVQSEKGKDIVRRLVAISDVVTENFTPRTMKSWGFGYDDLKKIKPDIIYVAESGFGHFGPYKNYRCYGPTAQAYSGLTYSVGLPGRPPAGWGYSYMDHMGGWYLALAVLLALNYRARTGRGQFIELGQAVIGCTLTGPVILDYTVNGRKSRENGYPPGNRAWHPRTAPHNTYRCRGTDAWCMIVCLTDEHWQNLCRAMGNPAWADDPKFATMLGRLEHQDELDRYIEAWTVTQDKHDLMYLLQRHGVPAAAVATSQDRLERDPQLQARGLYIPLNHPETGVQRYEGNPTHFEKTPGQPSRPAPRLGEDNAYVYGQLLHLSKEEIAQLQAEGVAGEAVEPVDRLLLDEIETERAEGVL